MDIEVLFSSGLTRSQVYNEILRNLIFHQKKEVEIVLQ